MGASFAALLADSVSYVINRQGSFFKSVFGDADAMPNDPIISSADYNYGAIANELEFVKQRCLELAQTFSLDNASGENLDYIVSALLMLSRQDVVEVDASLRARFRALVTQHSNNRRCTRWAIADAIAYLIPRYVFSIVEWFSLKPMFFEVRLVGSAFGIGLLDTAYVELAYIMQSYIGGPSTGVYAVFITDIVNRTKAAGVEFAVTVIERSQQSLDITARIV